MWNGRRCLQDAIEKQGFVAHRAYQEEVISLCETLGFEKGSVLECWDEAAREWVACRGQVVVTERRFGAAVYRSRVLDEMALGREMEGVPPSFPLHPAERLLAQAMLSDNSIGPRLLARAADLKKRHFPSKDAIDLDTPIAEVREFFFHLMDAEGFSTTRKRVFKRSVSASMSVGFDSGAWGGSQNINFPVTIVWQDGAGMEVPSYEIFLPGFYCYSTVLASSDLGVYLRAVSKFLALMFESVCQNVSTERN